MSRICEPEQLTSHQVYLQNNYISNKLLRLYYDEFFWKDKIIKEYGNVLLLDFLGQCYSYRNTYIMILLGKIKLFPVYMKNNWFQYDHNNMIGLVWVFKDHLIYNVIDIILRSDAALLSNKVVKNGDDLMYHKHISFFFLGDNNDSIFTVINPNEENKKLYMRVDDMINVYCNTSIWNNMKYVLVDLY